MKFPILEKNKIDYQVKKSRGEKLNIKVKNDGLVIIAIPSFYEEQMVSNFIEKHLDWILKNVQKYKIRPRYFVSGEKYLYLGKTYKIELIISKYSDVILNNDIMYIYSPSDDYPIIYKIVEKWRYNCANLLFNEMFYQMFQKMTIYLDKFPNLMIKKYKSRWGTCYFKRNLVLLNLALIHTPIECIEYVICHELSHFKHPNHSNDFHQLVNEFVDENRCLKLLKKYSPIYE